MGGVWHIKAGFQARWWDGTLIEARVRLDPFAQGWSGGLAPFFLSPLLIIYLLFPCLMLTLVLSSNNV